jgi:uncharacterized membrane protein
MAGLALPALRRIATIAGAVVLIGYPVAVWFALGSFSPRVAALLLLAVMLPSAIARLRRFDRAAMRSLALVPVVAAALLLLAAVLGSTHFALLLPAAINATLLFAFASTLWRGPPIIERFARLTVDDLTEAELRWCRGWTFGWSAFFVVNGGIALTLALAGSLWAWTTYNGLIGYIAMGMLFGIEYTVRKYRFGRLGDHALDRLLRRSFRTVRATEHP